MDIRGDEGVTGLVATANDLWDLCSDVVRTRVSDATWNTWFESVEPMGFDDDRLVLSVPNTLARERLEGRYLDLLCDVVSDVADVPCDVALEVRSAPDGPHVADDGVLSAYVGDVPAGLVPEDMASGARERRRLDEVPLNPRYTFEAFVIGASNRFAHAAALSVAEKPARAYNPLFIYGDAGLGKTHLLHAIAHYCRQNYPSMRVRYVSTEMFLNDYVDAIRLNTIPDFKRRYRESDVLLVDDVQFMERKEGLQEEFFHTFNTVHGNGRQVVMSSDRPPRSIATLEDRLRSRFEWGLITDVQPPELETRLAILRKKAEGEKVHVPHEALDYIGTHITENIRELEGALTRLTAFASLNRAPLTRELAEQVLGDLIAPSEPRPITPQVILDETAKLFGFTVDELCNRNRSRPLVTARQISMWVFREVTDFSFPAIAREFGGRDHTTVIHAVDKITVQMKTNRTIYEQVTELRNRVKSGG